MPSFVLRFCLILIITLSVTSPAVAQRVKDSPLLNENTHGIAAVVNNEVITNYDLISRIKLAMLSSGMPGNADAANKLAPQILRSLIDERLQRQEAKRLDISVPEDDIAEALQKIANDNHIAGGDMKSFLSSHGIPVSTLRNQVEATLGWSKVIQRSLRPKVQVGDDEVEAAVERIAANAGKREYLVSEIFLGIDEGKDEESVRKLADHLITQIKSGTPFGAIARQFSQNGGAASGGDIGWVRQGQLASELSAALSNAQRGQVIGPVRSPSGYHILGIRDTHDVSSDQGGDTSFRIVQAMTASKTSATMSDAAQMRARFAGCAMINELKGQFANWKWMPEEKVALSKAPSWLADQLSMLKSGEASAPTSTNHGLMVLFVCDKSQAKINIDKSAVMNAIGTEKLELQARTLLRNLRREAYLDIRLHSAAP